MKIPKALLAVLLLAATSTQAEAVTIGFLPASQDAMPGDTVFLDLVIDGLGAGGPDSLGAFDIDVAFDAAALSLVGFSLTELLGDTGFGEALDISLGEIVPGLVNVSVLSLLLDFELDALQASMFPLATFEFFVDSLAPGSETVVFVDTVFALGDAFGGGLPVTGLGDGVIRNPRSTGPGPGVPEPGTWALLLFGLAAVGLPRAGRRDLRR